ncbi:hypothetical protein SAMN05421743_105219 [Thalassobacillus cyri]|uniref:DUF3168 domain-containing protein n=1 Tax=Thalassobacillus cyri TaxID=571932 RepID=A0A1H4C0N5_9BACI|nr:hypothetical protein [Thalassobacillus cyri]SEA53887.1 hypothetical protein SAMN05421743_105219 [Thalassobacillus cyri]
MIEYVSPIPAAVQLLERRMEAPVIGNRFPAGQIYPALLIRAAGGTDYSRLQILSRAGDDITAELNIVKAINMLERYAYQLDPIRVESCIRESNPIPTIDEDTGKPEFWCYMRLNHLEA